MLSFDQGLNRSRNIPLLIHNLSHNNPALYYVNVSWVQLVPVVLFEEIFVNIHLHKFNDHESPINSFYYLRFITFSNLDLNNCQLIINYSLNYIYELKRISSLSELRI